MSTLKELKATFENIELMKVFEVEVTDKKTGQNDWITFDISIQKNSLVAQHVALTVKEEKSKKIAFKSVALDKDFSIDENLQSLFELCTDAIFESEFFEPLND